MSPFVHRLYIGILVSIVLVVSFTLAYKGISYYSTSLEERFYHPDHENFKPSGYLGHGLGIVGTLIILVGVSMYIARKRVKVMARWGRLKYWLEFHIFLCTLGPVMILFHTAFKFGGIVSIAFWSMVAVVASGVVGRFIYIQIPRSIEGRMLSLQEIQALKVNLAQVLPAAHGIDPSRLGDVWEYMRAVPTAQSHGLSEWLRKYLADRRVLGAVRGKLRLEGFSVKEIRQVANLIRNELTLNNRISRLRIMQKLFRYWHVVHLPFALIMLVIVLLHTVVTLAMGYKWIF
jgi:hypothetical protein